MICEPREREKEIGKKSNEMFREKNIYFEISDCIHRNGILWIVSIFRYFVSTFDVVYDLLWFALLNYYLFSCFVLFLHSLCFCERHQKSQIEYQENVPVKKLRCRRRRRRRRTHSDSSNSSSDGGSLSDDSCDKDETLSDNDGQVRADESKSKSHVLLPISLKSTAINGTAAIQMNRENKSASNTDSTTNPTHFDGNLAPTALALTLSNNPKHNRSNSFSKSYGDCFHMTQFSRSCVGSSKYLMNAHLNVVSDDDLVFESRFESGNLAKAIKITPVYYELYLRPDLYTNKHTQWFYFRVTNVKKGFTYRYIHFIAKQSNKWTERAKKKNAKTFSFKHKCHRMPNSLFFSSIKNRKKNLFNFWADFVMALLFCTEIRISIVNLVKSGSLYNEGMRPLMYSEIDAKESKIGWRRCGENIAYFKNEDSSYVFILTFHIWNGTAGVS